MNNMIPDTHAFAALLQAQILQCSGFPNCLPITPFAWIPVAILAALVVIMIAAIVYMLSGIVRSDRARQWSRFQIYEVILSLLLIFAFASIAYMFFLNPQGLFGSQLNIVPCAGVSAQQSGCSSAASSSPQRAALHLRRAAPADAAIRSRIVTSAYSTTRHSR